MGRVEITSVSGSAHVEPAKVRGSRFVGDAGPAEDEAGALAFVDAIRERDPDASHHCWAFRLSDGRARSGDDGEPGGSAGPPILQRIVGADLHDVVVVVTRWFGGTKLGTGGLIRAYGGCAAEVLAAAPTVTRPVTRLLTFSYAYELTGPVEGVLAAHDLTPGDARYAGDVEVDVAVPVDAVEVFSAELTEATAGQVVARLRGAAR